MKYSNLGNTGIKVSRIGFGGIPIQHVKQEDVNEILAKSIDLGINFLDTARGYTVSEEFIGNALVGKRDKVYIATKSPKRDYKSAVTEVETSLKNLKTDYIDLYQLHNVPNLEDLEKATGKDGALEALMEFKEKGMIKHIGITSHKAFVIEKAIEMGIFETVQFPFNVVEKEGEELFKKAKEKGIGTIAMKPLAGGALRNGRVSLKYILESPYLDVAIPGMDSVEQVIENAGATDDVRLTAEEKEELIKMAEELGETFCRRCGYCLPCPEGLSIPDIFLMEGYYTRYDLKEWAASRYSTFKVKADACVKCGVCETRCPYELPIRDMLERAKNVFATADKND